MELSKPQDGPATVFEADSMLSDIIKCSDGEYFGLVLVTNWPILSWVNNDNNNNNNNNNNSKQDDAMENDRPYQEFLNAVKSCFRKEDLESSSSMLLPAVYLYPTMHLHITLATFVSPFKLSDKNLSEDLLNAKKMEVLELVQSASKLPSWPTEPLKLVIDSAQIGKKAGILLWKDLSGGVVAMRNCLREAIATRKQEFNNDPTVSTIVPKIPSIIHSTFLRFSRIPETPGEEVQETFRSRIAGKIGKEFFHTHNNNNDVTPTTPILLEADTARLVYESAPYMHLPNDDKHVLWTCELTRK